MKDFSEMFIKLWEKHCIDMVNLDDHLLIITTPLRFKINEHLSLELEIAVTDKINILIDNEPYALCKDLVLNIPINRTRNQNKEMHLIESVDEAEEFLSSETQLLRNNPLKLKPKMRFWAHASNLQAWVENNYDTRILHRNLAFGLLHALTKVGDIKAKRVFKEEIAKRFSSGHPTVQKFLEIQGYIDLLSKEELDAIKLKKSY
ncbi:MAG: hypothetical protein GF353_05455 [Candidatus Lokiarchaeota archaeon]|nr:hypothetical protein [Candidatus Lokiarchaeota archaeon]